jgi:hypothetical protein
MGLYLETFDAPFVEPTTVDGVSAVQLLTRIQARNPDKRNIHVIWDNAAYHKGPDVRAFLARTACRIHLIQLPPYCPRLNPPSRAFNMPCLVIIERLWAVLHQYVTHNRYYPSQKQFANAILEFMRETILQEWTKCRDKVSDNFRVITHEGIVRLNSLVGLLPPRALYLRHNFLVCLVITKHRDTKTAEISRCHPSRSV